MALRILPPLFILFGFVLVQCKTMTFNQQKMLSTGETGGLCSPAENRPLKIPASIASAEQSADVYLELLRRWRCAERVDVKMRVLGALQKVPYPSFAVEEWRPLLSEIASRLSGAIERAKDGRFPDLKGQFAKEVQQETSSQWKDEAYLRLTNQRRGKRPDLKCMNATLDKLNDKFRDPEPLAYHVFLDLYLRAASAFTGCASGLQKLEGLHYIDMKEPFFVLPILWRPFTEDEFIQIASVPLHYVSLIDEIGVADGSVYDPEGFLKHDLDHMDVRRNELDLPTPEQDFPSFAERTKERNARFGQFYAEAQSITQIQGVRRNLFYWLHESGLKFDSNLLRTISTTFTTSDSDGRYWSTVRDGTSDIPCDQPPEYYRSNFAHFMEDCQAYNALRKLVQRYLAGYSAPAR